MSTTKYLYYKTYFPLTHFLTDSHIAFFFFFFFWLCWVFVSVRGLSLVVASGGHSSSRCAGLSLSWPLLLRSTGSRCAGSVVVAHGPNCSTACGIFPDQGSNPCPLHWQADSQPLRHQGSPHIAFLIALFSLPCRNESFDLPFHSFSYFPHLLNLIFNIHLLSIPTVIAYPYISCTFT